MSRLELMWLVGLNPALAGLVVKVAQAVGKPAHPD